MATRIRPLGVRILVKRIEEKDEMTPGGLFKPETAQEKPQQGIVLAVGRGAYENGVLVPVDIQAGEQILFGKYSGNEVAISGETYLILEEDEILAKFYDDGTPDDVENEVSTPRCC
jgi:chaperonin GroES